MAGIVNPGAMMRTGNRGRAALAPVVCFLIGLAWGAPASAYETDQLSGRHLLPPDSSEQVDAYVNARLERARVRAERKLRDGEATVERAGEQLRQAVIREFPFNYLAFGAPIEKWMTEELSQEGYAVETEGPGQGWGINIYDQYRGMIAGGAGDFPTPAFIFHFAIGIAGTAIAPTFNSGGVRYGADKWSHFFRLGYRYYQRSSGGTDDDAAIRYGTTTEMGGIGYQTSGALSFADLAANYDGYRFYRDLIGTANAYFALEGRTLRQLRPFRAVEYVRHDWDEYLNPCIYRPSLLQAIRRHLDRDRERVCAEYALWADEAVLLQTSLHPLSEYTDLSIAPERVDPFRIAELCAE